MSDYLKNRRSVVAALNHIFNETPSGSIDGLNKDFSLSQTFLANSLRVFLNGLSQIPTTDFSEGAGVNFSFVEAPKTADVVRCSFLY